MHNNEKVIIEVHCFPSICYFKTIKSYQQIILEAEESFQKQTYRSRFDILTSQGVQTVSIPLKKYSNNTLYKDIEINYEENWQNQILKTIQSAYASAPFYEYYIDKIEELFYQKEQYLFVFNVKVIELFKNILHQKWEIEFTNSFQKEYKEIEDKRGLHYKRKNINDWECDNKTYWQVFGKEFVPNLSVLDLLFCEGPLSPTFI